MNICYSIAKEAIRHGFVQCKPGEWLSPFEPGRVTTAQVVVWVIAHEVDLFAEQIGDGRLSGD